MNIDNYDPETIAHASSKRRAGERRWTELRAFYLHNPPMGGKRWFAEVIGATEVPGEFPRRVTLLAGTLERALKIIDDSIIGIAVCEQAREWAEDNRVMVENGKGRPFRPETDEEALVWLYGDIADGDTFPRLLDRDLGAKKSTVRMQLAAARDVMVPLRAVIPFIDRAAFRRAIKGNDRG